MHDMKQSVLRCVALDRAAPVARDARGPYR